MNSKLRHPFKSIGNVRSLRQQLIFWNILSLAILLSALGIAVRIEAARTIYGAIDKDLQLRSVPPRFRGRRPPPPFDTSPQGPEPPDAPGQPDRAFDETPLRHRIAEFMDGQPRSATPRMIQQPPSTPAPQRRWDYAPQNDFRPRILPVPLPAGRDYPSVTPFDVGGYTKAARSEPNYSTVTLAGQEMRIYSKTIIDRGQIEGVIQIPYPLTDANAAVDSLDHVLWTLLPLALVCAGLVGWLLTTSVLRRVSQMTRSAAVMRANEPTHRLPVIGNDEFSELSRTFNALLDRLHTALREQHLLLEKQRRFTADASHELKSPLTVIKGNASMALTAAAPESYMAALGQIDRAADTMSNLVQDLLLLASSDEGRTGLNKIEILASEVIDGVIDRLPAPLLNRLVVAINSPNIIVLGNQTELIRLVTNLVDNALRYSAPDTIVKVDVYEDDRYLHIIVVDHGDGIREADLPHLGERFHRVDVSRGRSSGGSGLGLSICREIVRSHDGTLDISSGVGIGTTVDVSLPKV